MKKVFVRDLAENQAVDSILLVAEMGVAETRLGTPYLCPKAGRSKGRNQSQELGTGFPMEGPLTKPATDDSSAIS